MPLIAATCPLLLACPGFSTDDHVLRHSVLGTPTNIHATCVVKAISKFQACMYMYRLTCSTALWQYRTCCHDAICEALGNGVQVVHDAFITGAAQPQQLVVLCTAVGPAATRAAAIDFGVVTRRGHSSNDTRAAPLM
jgi:hypothetical protein